jgi:hypothetical protein
MDNRDGMIEREKLPIISQSSLAVLPAGSSSSKVEESGEGKDEFRLRKYLYSYFEGLFNMP